MRSTFKGGCAAGRFGRAQVADLGSILISVIGSGHMAAGKTVRAAIDELKGAVTSLEGVIEGRFDRERDRAEVEGEVRRVNTDRARLAQELDQSQFRANRLEEVNREVSRRLVTAMETIRAVLDR